MNANCSFHCCFHSCVFHPCCLGSSPAPIVGPVIQNPGILNATTDPYHYNITPWSGPAQLHFLGWWHGRCGLRGRDAPVGRGQNVWWLQGWHSKKHWSAGSVDVYGAMASGDASKTSSGYQILLDEERILSRASSKIIQVSSCCLAARVCVGICDGFLRQGSITLH